MHIIYIYFFKWIFLFLLLSCVKRLSSVYVGYGRLIFSSDSAEDGKEPTNNEAPENNPQYTTVYIGNLAPEARRFLIY